MSRLANFRRGKTEQFKTSYLFNASFSVFPFSLGPFFILFSLTKSFLLLIPAFLFKNQQKTHANLSSQAPTLNSSPHAISHFLDNSEAHNGKCAVCVCTSVDLHLWTFKVTLLNEAIQELKHLEAFWKRKKLLNIDGCWRSLLRVFEQVFNSCLSKLADHPFNKQQPDSLLKPSAYNILLPFSIACNDLRDMKQQKINIHIPDFFTYLD